MLATTCGMAFTISSRAAARLGLHAVGNMVLSGDQMDSMPDAELQRIIGSVSVFYRTGPGHKLRIVKVNTFAELLCCHLWGNLEPFFLFHIFPN